jgi:hypothetical protein
MREAKALFEYFEQYEQDCDIEMEFDPIGIRCDFDEYENLKEIKENYQDIKTLEDLRDRTIVTEQRYNQSLRYRTAID